MRSFCFISLLAVFCISFPAWGTEAPASLLKIVRPFGLRLPLACTLGQDCWVLNYPDTGPEGDGKGTDPACGAQTYDGHKGTDIAIADKAAMDRGVNVLAAHDGVVTRARDSEEDHFPLTDAQLERIKADKKECGNAVLIDHGEGWQTMYCHLRRGSIKVKPQQHVKAGDIIAQVGASGMTQFPHLHIGVIHNRDVMDPFTGRILTDSCGESGKALFEKSTGLTYQPVTFMKQGFHDAIVDLNTLDQHDLQTSLSSGAAAFVFYELILGLRQDDVVALQITGPDGKIFAQRHLTQDKARARQLLYLGRKTPQGEHLQLGIYEGKITITRKGKSGKDEIYTDTRSINIAE